MPILSALGACMILRTRFTAHVQCWCPSLDIAQAALDDSQTPPLACVAGPSKLRPAWLVHPFLALTRPHSPSLCPLVMPLALAGHHVHPGTQSSRRWARQVGAKPAPTSTPSTSPSAGRLCFRGPQRLNHAWCHARLAHSAPEPVRTSQHLRSCCSRGARHGPLPVLGWGPPFSSWPLSFATPRMRIRPLERRQSITSLYHGR